MSTLTLEERLTVLEAEVKQLKQQARPEPARTESPWWEKIRGQFKDDPLYDEAMRLGREWRESEVMLNEGENKC